MASNVANMVSMEQAVKMQQSGEGSRLDLPVKKWEQKWPEATFSFVFFGKFLCKHKKWWPH
jgi:hypothetical protein